ncbi:hypothetical protein K461DRAFT_144825 [Myriangium duriaei CBS 260.36]|uniref:MAPEG family protein n=1 Tax=Myriangium duriaei CBS 260.36 TaxID=1168546 RepID=A0A9P4J4L1_9PEZI|nr:hypothetical protein K461DRAFT_144825 [Myriangium duriaei CBS 260.36]
MAPNLAILSIPAYWLLSLAPHSYALTIASGGSISKFDNRNPRSSTYIDALRKRLSPSDFARYERAEAAHRNGFENLPLYAAAVFAGLLADGVGKGGLVTGNATGESLRKFIYSFFAVRATYNLVYIATADNKKTWIRSALYFLGVGLCIGEFVRAAKVLGD